MAQDTFFGLLHKIVSTYEADTSTFYAKKDRMNSKFSGRFNYSVFASKMFDTIPTDEVGWTFVGLFDVAENYMHSTRKSFLRGTGAPYSRISVPELLMNMILAYQLPRHQTESENGNRRRSKKTIPPRVTLTPEQCEQLASCMLKVPIGPESNLWKQIRYVLNPSGSNRIIKHFEIAVSSMTESGVISYAALSFFMKDERVRHALKNPSTILQALYLGPLEANTIEMFASNRSESFRQQCHQIIKMAFEACRNNDYFEMYKPANIPPHHPDSVRFPQFVSHVISLKSALTGISAQEQQIPVSWAMAALKKFGQRRYNENTWQDEQFYDLIWTILAQRPHLKKHVCDTLETKFKDKDAAAYWRKMQPQQMSRIHINNMRVSNVSPLYDSTTYLNFANEIEVIHMVSNQSQILDFIAILKQLARCGRTTVGVDAEWSAYSFPSRATILQVSLSNSVYLIDLDSKQISIESYHELMKTLFENENIIKIGFSFGEDLSQLRAKFRLCKSLYNANRVICIGKMISKCIDDIDQLENADELKTELLPYLQDNEEKQENGQDKSQETRTSFSQNSADESTSADRSMDSKLDESLDENDKRKPPKVTKQSVFMNKGLSFICEKILGKPLDKTEQCSVWDRRPLRAHQLRYAAMDAHCMLMLYDKCEILFSRLNIDINRYIDSQPPLKVSLPLLTEYPL